MNEEKIEGFANTFSEPQIVKILLHHELFGYHYQKPIVSSSPLGMVSQSKVSCYCSAKADDNHTSLLPEVSFLDFLSIDAH